MVAAQAATTPTGPAKASIRGIAIAGASEPREQPANTARSRLCLPLKRYLQADTHGQQHVWFDASLAFIGEQQAQCRIECSTVRPWCLCSGRMLLLGVFARNEVQQEQKPHHMKPAAAAAAANTTGVPRKTCHETGGNL
eukprot:GHRR01010503.1.p1 GENE.GHRR01010503.1~~GHRR01010503.1.p1  ORF type:complete len:139 (-),score=45.09 GHRR01010503.1:433-849(-)